MEALLLVVVDVGSVRLELEVGQVLAQPALAGVVPVGVVVMVAGRGKDGDGAGRVVELAGVVPPELVPVDLLASHLGKVAGNRYEVRRTADHFDDVRGVAGSLVDEVAAAGLVVGWVVPCDACASRFRLGLAVGVADEADRRVGGRGRAEDVRIDASAALDLVCVTRTRAEAFDAHAVLDRYRKWEVWLSVVGLSRGVVELGGATGLRCA